MKRWLLAFVLALFGFYVAWPAWTGYRIRQAFADQNAALLESKIDFPSVRASLKPAVLAEIERTIEATRRDGGALASIIAGQIRGDVAGRLAERAVEAIMTPPNLIRIVREGRDMRKTVERVLLEQIGARSAETGGPRGALGGIAERLGQRRPGQPGAEPPAEKPDAGPPDGPPRRFSLSNVKRIAIQGPLAFQIGVAREPAATEPDVTAELRFTAGDWKVVGITPKLPRVERQ